MGGGRRDWFATCSVGVSPRNDTWAGTEIASHGPINLGAIGLFTGLLTAGATWQAIKLYNDGWPLKWVWGSVINATRDMATGQLRVFAVEGLVRNASGENVQLGEASIVSGITGEQKPVTFNDGHGKFFSGGELNPVPSDAEVGFQAVLNTTSEPLTEDEFLKKWASFSFIARYGIRSYERKFTTTEVKSKLAMLEPPTPRPHPSPKKPEQKQPSKNDDDFPEWLIFEFGNSIALGSTQIEKGSFANTKFSEFYVVQPHNIRAEYYVVYIPPKVDAFTVAEYVLGNYESLRERLAPKRPVEHKFGDKIPTAGEKLPFSNQIVIYHEPPLSAQQQEDLWRKFNERGILVDFHGSEYIVEKKAARGFR